MENRNGTLMVYKRESIVGEIYRIGKIHFPWKESKVLSEWMSSRATSPVYFKRNKYFRDIHRNYDFQGSKTKLLMTKNAYF